MSLSSVFNIAGSGMSAQNTRLNTVASNIANAETVSSSIDQTYRARHPVNITKSVVTLDKPGTSHKVSLEKGAAAPKAIKVSATWVDNGDGRDNDDLDLRIGILRPDGRMSIIQAPDKRGSFGADPFVFHTGDVVSASASAPGIETVEINPGCSLPLTRASSTRRRSPSSSRR